MSKGSRPRKVNRAKYDAEFERIFGSMKLRYVPMKSWALDRLRELRSRNKKK